MKRNTPHANLRSHMLRAWPKVSICMHTCAYNMHTFFLKVWYVKHGNIMSLRPALAIVSFRPVWMTGWEPLLEKQNPKGFMTLLTYVLMKSYFISIKDSLYTYELKYFPQIKFTTSVTEHPERVLFPSPYPCASFPRWPWVRNVEVTELIRWCSMASWGGPCTVLQDCHA